MMGKVKRVIEVKKDILEAVEIHFTREWERMTTQQKKEFINDLIYDLVRIEDELKKVKQND